jgi:hypothetical protein
VERERERERERETETETERWKNERITDSTERDCGSDSPVKELLSTFKLSHSIIRISAGILFPFKKVSTTIHYIFVQKEEKIKTY